MSKLKVAVVCSSNMNRSMEAHSVLAKRGFDVSSYGTGNAVKIPGPSRKQPNVYPFGTTYDAIYDDLISKDKRLYTENGMLGLVDRNRRIKSKPERFQDCQKRFDVILTCEEKVYDGVVADFEEGGHGAGGDRLEQPVHVINVDVVDNPEDATIGAFLLCQLMSSLSASLDLDDDIDEILRQFEERHDRPMLHTVSFY